MSDQPTSRGRPRKVSQLIEKYELDDIGQELESRWLGQDGDRDSLRTLADRFNRRLLRSATTESGMDVTPNEIDALYTTLRDPDVSSGTRTQIHRRLNRNGVEIDDLRSDFVSRQAIHTYLTKDRGVKRDRKSPSLSDEVEAINRMLSRTEAVTEDKLHRLRNNDVLSLGETIVSADITITCVDCGSQLSVDSIRQTGGCDCPSDD